MNKPESKQQNEPVYDWHEIESYIEFKYNKKVRDWAGKWISKDRTLPYQDFWHWLIDNGGINNGSYFYIHTPSYPDFEEDCKPEEPWINEILEILDKEFPEAKGELHCWVSW